MACHHHTLTHTRLPGTTSGVPAPGPGARRTLVGHAVRPRTVALDDHRLSVRRGRRPGRGAHRPRCQIFTCRKVRVIPYAVKLLFGMTRVAVAAHPNRGRASHVEPHSRQQRALTSWDNRDLVRTPARPGWGQSLQSRLPEVAKATLSVPRTRPARPADHPVRRQLATPCPPPSGCRRCRHPPAARGHPPAGERSRWHRRRGCGE